MKHRLKVLLLVVLAIGMLVGNSVAKPVAPGLKLGVLVSASGPLWFTAAFEKSAIQLAVADARDKDLANVTVIYDDAGDSEVEAKLAMQRLKAMKVDAIVAPLETDSAARIAKYNVENPVPIIAPSALAENVSSPIQNKNWFFRLASTSTQDGSALAAYISKTNPDLVVIVTDPDDCSKQVSKMINLGLTFRGFRVQQYGISDYKRIRQSRPSAFVLVSLEKSIDFFNEMSDWVDDQQSGYLVSGNLANYSAYPWAKVLSGFKALLASENVSTQFKNRLIDQMNRPALLNSSNSNLFGLAYRSYQLVNLLVSSARETKDLRNTLASAKNENGPYFDSAGYFSQQGYALFRYGNEGMYSQVGFLGPNSP